MRAFASLVIGSKAPKSSRNASKSQISRVQVDVSYFLIDKLRRVFCTRFRWVAPDAVMQRTMQHSSPEKKRHDQLGKVDQVRESIERANEQAYQAQKDYAFTTVCDGSGNELLASQ